VEGNTHTLEETKVILGDGITIIANAERFDAISAFGKLKNCPGVASRTAFVKYFSLYNLEARNLPH